MNSKPNIVLIMVDDMGYSDLGCYGGEIATPNIDSLAEGGIKFTQFYNSARCCPTRASLLTGLHPHQTGIGHMTNAPSGMGHDLNAPGYRGFLNKNCVTAGEVLSESGYHTFLSGKWHLGTHGKEKWPIQRGFERFYGLVPGGCFYRKPVHPRGIVYGEQEVEINDPDYYTTDAFTDYGIKFIDEIDDENPFFLYLAYNASHWPLQAKECDVGKYRTRYEGGWDKLREERYEKMQRLGVINPECKLSPRDEQVRAWSDVDDEKKEDMIYRMAVYAAQIDCVDQNVGRLVDYLERTERLDNTLILFLSDNGACAEGGEFGHGAAELINTDRMPGPFHSVGQAWANASNTPFRRYKHYVHEGGIATPLIAHWPDIIKSQRATLNHSSAYLIDIMPTILDITGADYPEKYRGNDIWPLQGQSMTGLFEDGIWREHEFMFWEHEDNCTCRMGKYKAIQKYDEGIWELYDMQEDRSELNDISKENADILDIITQKWQEWAQSHFVIPKPEKWGY